MHGQPHIRFTDYNVRFVVGDIIIIIIIIIIITTINGLEHGLVVFETQ